MRINLADKIAGQPILEVRALFRKAGSNPFSARAVMAAFAVSKTRALTIMREFEKKGLIEPYKPSTGCGQAGSYRTTATGQRISLARAVRPLSRQKADRIFADFLERVKMVNANDELTHYVEQVGIFGSYSNKKASDFADIDVMLDLRERKIPGRDQIEHNYERAAASGRRIANIVEHLGFGEIEVYRVLKARSPYLSFHPPSDLKRIGVKPRIVFKAGRMKSGS